MSTPRDEVATFLKQWANSPSSPHFAVLIEGAWGCGKTYFVKNLIEDKGFTKRKVIYLSLFGVTDAASFQTQLFFATASKARKTIHSGASLLGGALKAAIKFDLDGDGKGDGTANLGFSGVKKWIEKSSKHLNNAFIILDDLERCPMQASDLLGIINPFIEHGNARVLIVSNTEQIHDEKFGAVREKLVGKSFKLTADVENALSSFIKDVPNAETKERLQQFRPTIIEVYHRGDFNNLRQLRQFIWHLTSLLEKLDSPYLKNDDLVTAIIQQYWLILTEIKSAPNGVSFDDILGRNDPAAELTRQAYQTLEADEVRWISPPLFDEETENPLRKLLRKYGHDEGITSVISVQQWISIAESGVVDAKRLNRELALAPQVQDKSSWPSWKRLWYFLDWDFSDGDDDFQHAVKDVAVNLQSGNYETAGDFLHAAAIRLMFARNGITEDNLEDAVKSTKENIGYFLNSHFSPNLYRREKQRDLQSHDGLGFADRGTEEFREIYESFVTELASRYKTWLASQAGPTLLQQMEDDYLQFLGNLTYVRGLKTEQLFLDTPILPSIRPTDFVGKWLSLPRNDEYDLVGSLRDRYKHQSKLLDDELTWWEKVRDELHARSKAETIVPRSVQIRWLAEHAENGIIVPGKSVTADANVENTTPTPASPDPE